MNTDFQLRVRAAAVAGWWTLLIAIGFLLLAWSSFLLLLSVRPAWLLTFCGPDASWAYIQHVGFWLLAVYKLCLYVAAMLVAWLTLWARQLRKLPRG